MRSVCRVSMFAAGALLGFGSVADAKITIETHGRLASFGLFKSGYSSLGLNSTVSADFGLTKNWFMGVGAVGIWRVLPLDVKGTTGDVSNSYATYKSDNSKWAISFGRYNVDRGVTTVRTTDFVRGNIQGMSLMFQGTKTSLKALNCWISYINSYLDDGHLPGRIGSELGHLVSYDISKRNVGGEVLLFGLDYKYEGIFMSPWALFNSRAPHSRIRDPFNPLFQGGIKMTYSKGLGNTKKETEGWKSITSGNLLLQYGAVTSDPSDNLGGFLNVDEEVRYTRYRLNKDKKPYTEFTASAGLGMFASFIGPRGTIFALKDNLRLYGRFLTGSNYFRGGNVAGYMFGKFGNAFWDMHVLGAFGSYTEFSLAGTYKAYRQSRSSDEGSMLYVDVGLAYAYARPAGGGGSGLIAFVKMHF